MLGAASSLLGTAWAGHKDATWVGGRGTRVLLAHPPWGTATARKGTPTQCLISHKPLLLNGYKLIYFVISLILLSKADLVSQLY